MLQPAGPAAETIATLWWVMLAGATAIFVLVMALLALAIRRRGDGAAREGVWILGLGLAFPLTGLAALLAYGLFAGELLRAHPAPGAVTVRAEARQWEWRFGYEDAPGLVTQDVLHIPAGRPVDVQITTADVIHSFWVPRLAGKLDAVPGHVNVLRIEASAPGRLSGLSSEYSGPGYAAHAFEVVVHDAEGWDAFLTGRGR